LSDGATTSDEPGRILKNLGHPLSRLHHGDAAGADVAPVRNAVALGGDLGVQLGGRRTAPHGLDVDDEVDEVLDRRLVLHEAHGVGAGERQNRA